MNKLWLTPDEHLVIVHQTIQSSVILDVIAYEVSGDSHRVLTAQQIATDSGGTITETTVVSGPALLESVSVGIRSGTVLKGQVAVGAFVRRLSGSDDLLAAVSPIRFPSTNYPVQLLPSISFYDANEGWYRRVYTGTDPAAGSECSDTVPSTVDWMLDSARLTLVTDATVANRRPQLYVDNVTSVLWISPANSDVAASLTNSVNFISGGSPIATSGTNQVALLPERFLLSGGYRLRTNSINLQAGDNYGSPIYTVMERLTLAR